jgi:uncharacterized protein YkwD
LPFAVLIFTVLAAATLFSFGPRMTAAATVGAIAPPELTSAKPTDMELALFNLSNQDRIRAGLPALRFDLEALAIARARAASQPSDGSLTHFNHDGTMVFADLLGDSGIDFLLAGENLARIPGPIDSAPEVAETSLMNSPTHRANILEPTYDLLAVGAVIDAKGRVVFAQVFRSI